MMDVLKQRLKRFVDDERAVSPVVGFVLMFALIMIVFTIYNADVVPAQNQDVEYEHTQTIEGQMEQLSAAFLSADENGSTKSVALQLGVQYPTRVFGINPGTPVGTLNTSEMHEVRFTGDTETAEFNTSFVKYTPNYNLMQQETQYSIEHGLLVKDYDGSDNTRLKGTGALFSSDDETVNLRLISSNLQESRMSTVVTAENVDTHKITTTSSDATLSLPTTLEKEEWNRTITGSEQVTDWNYSSSSSGVNRVNIELKNGTPINVNRVTAGNPPPEGEIGIPPYIQNVTKTSINASLNSTTNLTVETMDIFGSHYDDVEINASTNGDRDGDLTPTSTTSGGQSGEATFAYESAPSDAGDTVEVTASLPNRTGENTSVTFELNYPADNGSEPGGGSSEDQISVSRGSLEEGPTDLIFRITPSPVDIAGFSVTTQNELESVTQTEPTHGFYIYTASNDDGGNGLQYPYGSQSGPIQFDGQEYDFDRGPGRVQSSLVQLKKFDSSDEITFTDFVDSRSEADIVVTFILEDGTERPIFIDATVNE